MEISPIILGLGLNICAIQKIELTMKMFLKFILLGINSYGINLKISSSINAEQKVNIKMIGIFLK